MRTVFRFGIIGLTVAALAGLAWGLLGALTRRRERSAYAATLPSFTARNLAGQVQPAVATAATATVFIYFEPDCDHCQREAADIRRHSANFQATRVLWLSTDSLAALHRFARQYDLLADPRMSVLQITPTVAQHMGFFTVPDIRVYGPSRELQHRYRGETSAVTILQQLGSSN